MVIGSTSRQETVNPELEKGSAEEVRRRRFALRVFFPLVTEVGGEPRLAPFVGGKPFGFDRGCRAVLNRFELRFQGDQIIEDDLVLNDVV